MSNKMSEALTVRIREFKERKARKFPDLSIKIDTDYEMYRNLHYMQ